MLFGYYNRYSFYTHGTKTSVKYKRVSPFYLKGQIWKKEKPFALTTIKQKKILV